MNAYYIPIVIALQCTRDFSCRESCCLCWAHNSTTLCRSYGACLWLCLSSLVQGIHIDSYRNTLTLCVCAVSTVGWRSLFASTHTVVIPENWMMYVKISFIIITRQDQCRTLGSKSKQAMTVSAWGKGHTHAHARLCILEMMTAKEINKSHPSQYTHLGSWLTNHRAYQAVTWHYGCEISINITQENSLTCCVWIMPSLYRRYCASLVEVRRRKKPLCFLFTFA